MTRYYKKVFKLLRRESKEAYKFSETHPGHEFSHLIKSKHKTVPRITVPTETVWLLKDLQLNTTKPTEESLEKHEIYAKMALLMFYPFRSLADFTIEGSYWKISLKKYKDILNTRTQYFGIRDLIYYSI